MKLLFSILILIIIINPVTSQNEYLPQIVTSNKAFDFIKSKNYSGFKGLIIKSVIRENKDDIFVEFVDKTAVLLKQYGLPNQNNMLVETSQTTYKGKVVSIISLNFPLSTSENPGYISDYQVIMTYAPEVKDDSIISFKLRDFIGPGKRIVEKAKKRPHLESFNFKTRNIDWFRIWYNSGFTDKEVGNNKIYALSGNYQKLKKAKINERLTDIFKLINKSKIEKKEYKYGLQKSIGDPEYLYLRFDFQNYPYKEYKEFSIFTILTKKNGVQEPNAGYIVITHSDVFKYYLNIIDNFELYEKLKELAYIDYGELLEKNP